uniref:Uncharacterized protein n=1 Tax=Triticum urartu TaxID=4572 RepID=A0A8R7QTD6_TRIUA
MAVTVPVNCIYIRMNPSFTKERLEPPGPFAVGGRGIALRRRVALRRLVQLGHVVAFLLGLLQQLVVHLVLDVRLPAQDLHTCTRIWKTTRLIKRTCSVGYVVSNMYYVYAYP